MERIKLFKFIIAGLVLLNIIIMVFFLYVKPGKSDFHDELKKGQGPKQIIIDRLHFSESQQKQYTILVEAHRTKMFSLNEASRKMHDNLFLLLKTQPVNKVAADSIINSISNNQKELEQLNFSHFNEIRTLCTSDQTDEFNELLSDLGKLFAAKVHPIKK
jgi:periplasmic protein CpxP/Spy